MRSKATAFVLGGALVGFLATPAMADFWHWNGHDRKWEHRAERSEQADLTEAKRVLDYDRAHHANRSTIAGDENRVREIERDLKR